MVPVRLLLRNFLSYRETTELDFTGIHVACLSGDNGHGKSALLDAITWALWGKARVSSDDDLVHLGQMEMEVELEFEHGAERYRVLRKRRRGGGGRRGDTALELQALGPEGWRQITGNTVRATQQRIVELLRLDHETFINSAFLMQGRADEFTTRAPGERKKVLGDILGLGFYDELVERAKAEAKARDIRLTETRAELALIDQQTADLDALRADLERIRVELKQCDDDLARRASLAGDLREAKRIADLHAEALHAALARLQEAEGALVRINGDVARHEGTIAQHEAVIARAAEIERGFATLEAARAEEAEHGRRAGQALGLQKRCAELERAIEGARQELETTAREAERQVAELEERAGRVEALTAERDEAERLRREAEALAGQLRDQREQARAVRDEAQTLAATNAALRAAIDALKAKFDEIAAAEAACPLCARPLGPDEKERITATYQEQGRADQRAYIENKQRLAALQAEADALDREAEALDAQRADRERHATARLTALDLDLADGHAAIRDLDGARVRFASARAALEGEGFAPEERVALGVVTAEIAALGYDAALHEELRGRVAAGARFAAEHRALAEARSLLRNETESRARALADLADWQRRRDAACAETEELRGHAGLGDDLSERLTRAEAEHRAAEEEVARLRQALGAVENGVEYREGLLAQRGPKVAALGLGAEERRLYDELAKAFGRQGVQALLIDAALPELTEEANRLLERMTSGRMKLMITTQRATQKGDMTETLDIRIADELGTRAYEMYSGGEAFRVDFALRVALSKLLARRAGAPLPTLVVDEGFGTQDASGRERLVEAITAVQDDFRMVLVVTHIDELRDVFPHRIHVTKTGQGSQVEVF